MLSWRFKRHLSSWVTAQSGLLFRLKKARDDANYSAIREAARSTRKDKTLGVWREGIHEFVLAGNGGLRLCR